MAAEYLGFSAAMGTFLADVLLAIKIAVLYITARAFRLCGQDGAVFAVVLSQVGEFAFVILTAARVNGSLPADIANQMNAIVAASILSPPRCAGIGGHR